MSHPDNLVLQTISNRHCKRAYLDKPVSKDLLAHLLKVAAEAPSSKNTQPWQVSVVMGDKQAQLSKIICDKFDQGIHEEPDYVYTPEPWPEGFLERARACGYGLFELKGIGRKDYEARQAHNRENFTFFGAPVSLYFHLPAGSERGQFLDLGFFMQNLMLGLVSEGLASCPQYSLTSYSDTLREFLGLKDRWIISGMSVGYPDESAKVNTYVPERLPLENYVSWVGA